MATDKTLAAVMNGKQDSNIKFNDLRNLLSRQGFQCRIKGDHFIYHREDIADIINIQPDGNKAKAYQVKQIRLLFKRIGVC